MTKIKIMVYGLGSIVGLMILFGVLTGMIRISFLNEYDTTLQNNILTKMNSMGNLELVRYKFSKPENGEAAVCINMRKIKDTDIQTAGDEVTIYLPEPKFCYENQKQDRVQNPDGVIKQQAEQSGIFKVAKENAEKLVRSVVSSVTQKQIIINYIK